MSKESLNWEQTIKHIRTDPAYADLVHEAYLGEDTEDSVLRFSDSEEFANTKELITSSLGKNDTGVPWRVLDLGAGNGIATIAFATSGFNVTALEPDPSDTIGAGAIKRMARKMGLEKFVKVEEAWGEALPFPDGAFDVVYGRQVMHHAHDLNKFVAEAARVLREGGIFVTTRDHVVFDATDKENFLERHPLHKFYGGENAFSLEEYETAITSAGLSIEQRLAPGDSAINYAPWSRNRVKTLLKRKTGFLHLVPFMSDAAFGIVKFRLSRLPGCLYSFVARLPKTK